MAHAYRCREFPGMGDCPGYFVASTRDEVLKLTELHARVAHEENPDEWSAEDRRAVIDLIRPAET